MSIDFAKPVKTDNYDTGFLSSMRAHVVALALWLDPALVGSVSNPPTGARRLNSGVVEQFNGTSWVAQPINGINYSGGNVGIGTAAPSTMLHMYGSNPRLRVEGDGASYYPRISIKGLNTAMTIGTYAGATLHSTGDFAWFTGATAHLEDGTERMRLKASNGYLGINTASPSAPLEVVGPGNAIAILLSGINPTLSVGKQNDGVSYYAGIKVWSQYNVTKPSHYISQDAAGIFWETAGGLQLRDSVAGATRMVMDGNGNMGIGATTPNASALLDVQSTTKGLRLPNMTTTQKNAIGSPAAGLMVFDTTLGKACLYTGAAWQTITSV